MKKAGGFLAQGTVRKLHAEQSSCSKFPLKILDKKISRYVNPEIFHLGRTWQ